MISARPSKVLSGWTYESKPKPLRSPRTAGEYRETDVGFFFFILHFIQKINVNPPNSVKHPTDLFIQFDKMHALRN